MRLSPNFFLYRKYNVQDLRINLYFVHPYYERKLEKVREELREGDGKRRREENNRELEPVFLNVYGAPESIPRNEFRQPM
jgi:hypothetical protein